MADRLDGRLGLDSSGRRPTRLRLVEDDGTLPIRPTVRVLYVEDDEDDVFLFRRHMARLPSFTVEVETVVSIDDAHRCLASDPYDVVFCDFWLGGETTVDLIGALGARDVPIPVVLVSSLETEDLELIGRRAGAAGYVAKQDLSIAGLDQILTTLLASGAACVAEQSFGIWLRGMLRGLDRARTLVTAGQGGRDEPDGTLADLIAHSAEIRSGILEKLVGDVAFAEPGRLDALAHLDDAVREARRRSSHPGAIRFIESRTPVEIESSSALFADLVQGFLAEASDAADRGEVVDVQPVIGVGVLRIDLAGFAAGGRPSRREAGGRAAAAAEARRDLVTTLARACGGTVVFGGESPLAASLSIPLRRR